MKTKNLVHCTIVSSLALVAQNSFGALFSDDFDVNSTASWTVNSNFGGATNAANFFFDYSVVGIPSAPNSIGGSTRGLKLGANLLGVSTPSLAGISVSPTGQSFTGDYTLKFDWWHNWLGSTTTGLGASAGGSGSTQLSTFGIRTSGTVANRAGVSDSVFFGATGDGASAQDFRTYSSEKQGGYIVGDGHNTYAAGSQNSSSALYQTLFPAGASAPAAQTGISATTQSGLTLAGTAGFRWHDVEISQTGTTVTWKVDGTLLATLDTSSLTNATAGNNILFGMSDTSTGAGTPANIFEQLDFTLIDNVNVIAVPEPTSAAFTGIGLAVLAGFARRRKN
jgi:hypothetical protein